MLPVRRCSLSRPTPSQRAKSSFPARSYSSSVDENWDSRTLPRLGVNFGDFLAGFDELGIFEVGVLAPLAVVSLHSWSMSGPLMPSLPIRNVRSSMSVSAAAAWERLLFGHGYTNSHVEVVVSNDAVNDYAGYD